MAALFLKGLNEFRAVAAISVVVYHTGRALNSFGFKPFTRFDFGPFGVTLFFALSGFLITYLLLLEKEKLGRILVRNFYVRRILRIWPLYFGYILLTLLALHFFDRAFNTTNLVYYFLLIPNLVFPFDISVPLLYHYWSLGVEENFYIIWPLIVSYKNVTLRFLLALLVFLIACRAGLYLLAKYFGNPNLYEFSIYNRVDCMVIGAIGAFVFKEGSGAFYAFFKHKITQVGTLLVYALTFFNMFNVPTFFAHSIFSVATVVIIISLVSQEKPWTFFNNRFMDYLGRVSFGIYVYHPLVIFLLEKIIGTTYNTPHI